MKLGLQIPNFTLGVPDDQLFETVVALATAAEENGFDSVWVMDHFYQLPPLGGESQPMLEAYTLLGALGARTSRVGLGTLVTGVTYRNPALLAKIVTTLDVITAGRAILGLGAAWHDTEHDAMGFEFPSVRERMDRLEEAVQICRAMFREERPSFDGQHYQVRSVANVPRPVQPGGPPIMIGGGGEKRTLRLVAQYADMCNISGDAATIRHKVGVLRQHCEDVGRDPAEVTVTRMSSLVLTESAEQTATTWDFLNQVAGEAAAGFTVGQEDEVVAQVEEMADAGVNYSIFNMPTSSVEQTRHACAVLAARFGR